VIAPKPDLHTSTETTVLDVFVPGTRPSGRPLSYWEGDGAGIEPGEFTTSVSALRATNVVSRDGYQCPRVGKINSCRTPYQNDLMTFEAFETIRNELKHKCDHLSSEMLRVQEEWTRPPSEKWFALKDGSFTVEHCRYMEILRRNLSREGHVEN
jgi:hypothetical protein